MNKTHRFLNFRPTTNQEMEYSRDAQVYYPQNDNTDFNIKLEMIQLADEIILRRDWLHDRQSKVVAVLGNELDKDVYAQTNDGLEKIVVDQSAEIGVMPKPQEVV